MFSDSLPQCDVHIGKTVKFFCVRVLYYNWWLQVHSVNLIAAMKGWDPYAGRMESPIQAGSDFNNYLICLHWIWKARPFHNYVKFFICGMELVLCLSCFIELFVELIPRCHLQQAICQGSNVRLDYRGDCSDSKFMKLNTYSCLNISSQ